MGRTSSISMPVREVWVLPWSLHGDGWRQIYAGISTPHCATHHSIYLCGGERTRFLAFYSILKPRIDNQGADYTGCTSSTFSKWVILIQFQPVILTPTVGTKSFVFPLFDPLKGATASFVCRYGDSLCNDFRIEAVWISVTRMQALNCGKILLANVFQCE